MHAHRRAAFACALVLACAAAAVQAAAYCAPSISSKDEGARPSTPEAAAPPTVEPSATALLPWAAAATAIAETQAAPTPERAPIESGEPVEPAAAEPPPAIGPPAPPTTTPEAAPESILRDNQLVVYYGTPLASGLGVLGTLSPQDAAAAVKAHAATFDAINGDEVGAVGALDVIYSLAQAEPTKNGNYIRHLPDKYVEEYMRLADEHDLQVVLDLQIGRATVLDEVKNIERFLRHPRVHVAIDPEYAVGPEGVPIQTPGRISGHEINEVKSYLRSLVDMHDLPPKVLVVHQYMDQTIVEPERVEAVENVDYVLNMDAFGDIKAKKKKYRHFSSKPPEDKLDGFNIFLKQDHAVLTEQEILDLSPVPHVIFYQ